MQEETNPEGARPLRLGANYTPSRGWFHSWQDFSADEVRRDLESIAKLGLDHIRVFPLWPELQPSRTLIRRKAIQDVGTVVDIAAEFGLDASVDVLQGHLSSFDFLPAWVGSWHRRNIFTDPEVVEAEAGLVRALAAELSGRPNALGLTVGNETNQFAAPWHPDPHAISGEEAGNWLSTLLGAAKAAWPGGTHQHSFDDSALFNEDMPFTARHGATLGDLSTVHSWVFGGAGQRYGEHHPALVHFADYLVQFVAAFAADPARPVWVQEVGAPAPWVAAGDAADFAAATVRNLVGSPNLWGITWWCSHDVSRGLGDFPELEYSLGLLDSDRRPKPAGLAVAGLAGELRRTPPAVVVRKDAMVIALDDEHSTAGRGRYAVTGEFFDTWLQAAVAGQPPALVLESRAADPAYLAARGITDIIGTSRSLRK